MEVLHVRCAGLDVHKAQVTACRRVAGAGKVSREVRSFETTTTGLLALSEWLTEWECTHVALEATGVYWKPVWHILEGSFELVLANAQHVRNVPGRKSDVNDATWLAELLAHGLIRGSFVPPAPVQEMRDLTRTRKQIGHEIVRHTQRIEKVLEDANIKVTGFISDILGLSGRAFLGALIAGETDPEKLADLAHHRIKTPRAKLVESLRGRVTAHHRFLLKLHLEQIASLEVAMRELEARMGAALAPFREQVELLKSIPGVSDTVAQVIAGEIGLDMQRFPTAAHLISWSGLCPKMNESAGKTRSTRLRKGGTWLKTTLVTAAWSVARMKGGYLRSLFVRIKSRRGAKKAIIAVAASILTSAYHMLRNNMPYQDLGNEYLSKRDKHLIASRLIKRLGTMGYTVEVKAAS